MIIWPLAVKAQQTGKMLRIGYLSPIAGRNLVVEAFEDALQQLGWIRDRNISIDYRFSGGRQDKIAGLTAELLGSGVDVVVAVGPPFALAAKRATTKIPIVFILFTDPVAWGLVSNCANPGDNATGITTFASNAIVPKYLELLKEAVPSATRVAVLFSTERNINSEHKAAVTATATALNLDLDEVEAEAPSELAAAIGSAKDRGDQAVFVWPTGFAFSFAKQISDVANSNGLPSIHPSKEGALAGGLLGYGPDFGDENRRAAAYVDKILKGAEPGSLPVEQASKYQLVLNLKTAKALGLTLPPSLIARADEVIE